MRTADTQEGVAEEEGGTEALEKDWNMKQAAGVLGEDRESGLGNAHAAEVTVGWSGPQLAAGSL